MPSDPLKPAPSLLCKLGSAIVHADEAASSQGHHFDAIALRNLMNDSEVLAWLAAMRAVGMVPEKRAVSLLDTPMDKAIKSLRAKKGPRRV